MGDRIERPQRYIRGLVEYPPGQRQWLEYADKVEARIAQLEAERRWIPVNERLPEYDTAVLCFCRIYGRFVGEYSRIEPDIDEGIWSGPSGTGILPPTDWMPLPSPPEDK